MRRVPTSPPRIATPSAPPLYKKIPDTGLSPPSRLSIRDNHPQLFRDPPRLPTTTSQSSSPDVNTRTKYRNVVTFYSCSPYTSNALSELSLISDSASLRLFRSAPLAHWAVAGCLPFRSLQGTRMSHRLHHGWGRFTSYRMTTVSRTCRCRKCTRIDVLVAARPGHPSTGHLRGPLLAGNVNRNVCGPPTAAGVPQIRRVSATLPWDGLYSRDTVSNKSHQNGRG